MSNIRTNLPETSEAFGALANPHRLKIFLKLVDCCGDSGSCSTDAGMSACVGELADGLGLAKSTVSHHLKELRRTGLITMRRDGRNVHCTINTPRIRELSSFLKLALPDSQTPKAQSCA